MASCKSAVVSPGKPGISNLDVGLAKNTGLPHTKPIFGI